MFGQTTGIEKSTKAGADVTAYTIGKFGADDDTMVPAASATDQSVGIFQHEAVSGSEVRVMLSGISRLKLGGTVTRGAKLTSDGTGQGVAAAPAAGSNAQIIAIAMASGVSGDIIPVFIAPSVMQG